MDKRKGKASPAATAGLPCSPSTPTAGGQTLLDEEGFTGWQPNTLHSEWPCL